MTIVNQIGSIPPYHISVPSPSCLESYWITLPLPPPEHNTHTPKFRHNFAVVYENCMAAYTLYQPLYTKTIIIFASIGSLRVPSFFPVASASSAATGLFHSLWQALRVAWKIASLLSFSTLPAEADLAITAIDLQACGGWRSTKEKYKESNAEQKLEIH